MVVTEKDGITRENPLVPSWPTSQRLGTRLGEAVAAARGQSLSAGDVDVYKGPDGEGRTGNIGWAEKFGGWGEGMDEGWDFSHHVRTER